VCPGHLTFAKAIAKDETGNTIPQLSEAMSSSCLENYSDEQILKIIIKKEISISVAKPD